LTLHRLQVDVGESQVPSLQPLRVTEPALLLVTARLTAATTTRGPMDDLLGVPIDNWIAQAVEQARLAG